MTAPKILVVYYSRTGNTRSVAGEIANRLRCPIEALVDMRRRKGLFGFMRSAFDATLQRPTPLCATLHDPAEYDLVIVGTPVWARAISSPVRTYLERHRGQFHNVAFFLTHAGPGPARVFNQMTELSHCSPCCTLAITEHELDDAEFLAKTRDFANRIRRAVQASPSTQPAHAGLEGARP